MAWKPRYYTQSEDVDRWRDYADQYNDYNESDTVGQYRQQYEDWMNNKPGDWTGGQYGSALQDLLDQINNRGKFSYDLNGDMLYQQYRDQYARQGKMAMMDTLAQAANLTGGYGNSYAVTAGNQAYQGYLQGLNDKIPELYQLALGKYNAEGEDLYNRFGLTNQMYQNEYGEWRDKLGDWSNERDWLYGQYMDERGFDYDKWQSDRDYYYGRYSDERNWDYQQWADQYDRDWQEYVYNHPHRSGGGGSSGGKGGGSNFSGNDKTDKALYNIVGEDDFINNHGRPTNNSSEYYGSYKEYVQAMCNRYGLNEEEVAYVLQHLEYHK